MHAHRNGALRAHLERWIAIPSPNAKNYNRIAFSATVTFFDADAKLTISHGKTNPWCSAYIVIDAETVSVYEYLHETRLLEKVPHGLAISGLINVSITVGAGFSAKLMISTSTGSFCRDIYWNGSNGEILAELKGAELADCTLSYRIDGVNKEIWLFGDSYFDHWCKHAFDFGCDHFYLDGYSGRSSEAALASLRMNLTYAKPKTIVWLMGMNDPDGEEANPSWMRCYHTLREICSENGIKLILSTVPNTPTRKHRYKNALVRNSGYRYLDISSAVGADTCSSWKNGLIDPDGVHPSPDGAKVIARYILSALPETEHLIR